MISPEVKVFLGVIATLIALFSYIPYFKDIFSGKTKPHAFSWLVWFLLTAIGFFAQLSDGGGAGAWVTGFTACVSFFIFLAAVFRGEKKITFSDKLFLVGAILAMIPWLVSDDPLISVVLITIIDAFGFAPTFRKSYYKPFEETMITYLLAAIKFLIGIVALGNYSAITILYPLSLVIANAAFVIMLVIRRRQITRQKFPVRV